ncbi:Adenylyl cyclase class-3/4/guanylyl cyclase [Trypanosoma melophagium]|uniref:Adenylyl cyclase class-3/4/guanylyl cyclase n=1 Tax=Trypanosoma melophagium TaxID=715481 RepID=UPI00351A2C11|nr:Adenylyl cyclase class-3/4/guanylyl cyclase [Trypanosoma melophagium]
MHFHTLKTTSVAHRDSGTYFRPLLCLTALLCLTQLLLYTPQSALCQEAGAPKDTVKLLTLNITDHPVPASLRNSFVAGFNASLWSRDFTVTDGIRVEIVVKETTFQASGDVVERALKADPDILALQGIFGDTAVEIALPALAKHSVVAFAPITAFSSLRKWNPNVYFVCAEPAAELLALVNHAVNTLRVRRLGFMYLQNEYFGNSDYEQAERFISSMGYEFCGVFTLKSSLSEPAEGGAFNAMWEAFADTRPQAVIVFGAAVEDTAEFIKRMLTDRRTAGAYLLGYSLLQSMLLSVWREAVDNSVRFLSGQVITTGTNPLANDTGFTAIRRFQKAMKTYLSESDQTIFEDHQHFLNYDTDGEMMVAGWITGEVLLQAMSSREWLKDRASFVASLFDQRRYLIDDIVIGDYGSDCRCCFCISGRCRFVKDFRAEKIIGGDLQLDPKECYSAKNMLKSTLVEAAVFMDDSSLAVHTLSEFAIGILAAFDSYDSSTLSSYLALLPIASTVSDAHLALRRTAQDTLVHAVAGIVTEAMLDVSNVTFIDPMLLQPRLNKFRKHVIHLSPTVEQELFVLAQYLGNKTGATAAAVIRCDEAAAVEDVLRRSLVTFGGSLRSAALLAGGDSLAGRLPSSGAVFVVGLADGDAALIAGHLTKHSGVRVFVLFSELSLRYAEFTAAFDGSGSADRLVFATSLPHWADEKTESETVRKFHTAVTNETDRTPLSLRAFANTRVLGSILFGGRGTTAALLARFFYMSPLVALDDMVYGSFYEYGYCPSDGNFDGRSCAVNYGATHISVWSMSRALNPTVPELFPPVTPSMEYVEPVSGGLPLQQLIGIIVGSVAGVVLLVGLLVWLLWRRSARDNANAPKEPTDPVTLVFTDIESSTALWSACPEIMPDAVATHHRLIRALIAKYRCYEVKTIGESFMIASRSVFAAVQLVRELQQSFLHHDWGTSAIDDAYHVFEEGKAAEDDEYVPPTARLDAAVYRQYWNGLRVRAAVHTGLADIRHDEVTKGYDYYGSTSNTASRTESVANGGQVLLTRAAYKALSTAEREQVDVTALGPVALRGVPKPVEMYQLDAVPGRTFAALRLDRGIDVAEGLVDTDGASSSARISGCSTLSGNTHSIAFVLTVMYGIFPPAQRLKLLLPLCERWNVCVPPKANSLCEDDYCRAVIQRLALKAGRVRDRNGDNDDVETLFTMSTFLSMYNRCDSTEGEDKMEVVDFGVVDATSAGRNGSSSSYSVVVDDICSSTWDSDFTIYAKGCV